MSSDSNFFCWYSCNDIIIIYIFCYDSASGDHGIFTDMDTRHDTYTRADPDIVSNHDFAAFQIVTP